jgi:ribosomal protein S18 acetylase RimI-like enzyme
VSAPDLEIRLAVDSDREAIWSILEPTIRAGETYTLPRDLECEPSLRYWFSPGHEVFVAEAQGDLVGTYYLRANQLGGGSHVANCGYMTAPRAFGRGTARRMCAHSIQRARERKFRAMQFNFVVSSNHRAIRLWESFGFEVAGRIRGAFLHPALGYVDALVMWLDLTAGS